MGTCSKGTLFTGHEASVYFVGCNVIIAFVSSTSDEETFWKQTRMTVALKWFLTVLSVAFSESGTTFTPTPRHNLYPLPIPLPKKEDHRSSSSHESSQKNALFQHSKALGTTFNHGVKYVKVNEGSSFI